MVNIFFVIKFNYNYFIFKNFKHKFKIGGWGLDGSTSAHMQLVGKQLQIILSKINIQRCLIERLFIKSNFNIICIRLNSLQ